MAALTQDVTGISSYTSIFSEHYFSDVQCRPCAGPVQCRELKEAFDFWEANLSQHSENLTSHLPLLKSATDWHVDAILCLKAKITLCYCLFPAMYTCMTSVKFCLPLYLRTHKMTTWMQFTLMIGPVLSYLEHIIQSINFATLSFEVKTPWEVFQIIEYEIDYFSFALLPQGTVLPLSYSLLMNRHSRVQNIQACRRMVTCRSIKRSVKIRTVQFERPFRDDQIQLPNHFKANQETQRVIDSTVHMSLEHWRVWGNSPSKGSLLQCWTTLTVLKSFQKSSLILH